MYGCLKIEEKMKLLLPLLYGLLLCGLVQCSVGQTAAASTTKSPPNLVAPIEEDEEGIADELVAEVAKYGVVLNGVDLCGNIATKTFLPFVGNKHYYINCKNQSISSVGNCNIASIREEECEGKTDCSIVFDYKLQICTTNDNVDKNAFMKECEPKVLSSFCYDRTCTKYVLCFYNTPVLRECQDGLQYNSKTDRCDFPEFVDCVENKCSQEETPHNITYVASKASCEKYFICANGQPNEQECSSGLYFDETCPCCKVKDQVDCTLQSAQQRNIKPFSRSPPQRADIICPPQGVHFYAHKRRRDAYYYCVQGNGITLDCTPGLLYDVKTRECREPKYIA